MTFTFKKLDIPEVTLVETHSFSDDRGFFLESFKESSFTHNGINTRFVQDNFSHSVKGVLRGLHYPHDVIISTFIGWIIKRVIFDKNLDFIFL